MAMWTISGSKFAFSTSSFKIFNSLRHAPDLILLNSASLAGIEPQGWADQSIVPCPVLVARRHRPRLTCLGRTKPGDDRRMKFVVRKSGALLSCDGFYSLWFVVAILH